MTGMSNIRKTNIQEARPVDSAKLSENDLVFYYSREHRLKKAGARVRALYDDAKKPHKRLFVPEEKKPALVTFLVIIAVCILLLLFLKFAPL
jgi:hypothetical protein